MIRDKCRILHVIPALEYSGMQIWLLSLLKYLNKQNFQTDIVVRTISNPALADRFAALNAKVHCIPGLDGPLPFDPMHFIRIVRFISKNGPYRAIHCHEGLNSFPFLIAAKHLEISTRIVHSHSGYLRFQDWISPRKTGIRWFKRKLIRQFATHGFASRPHTASALFGRYWISDKRWHTFFCGIDPIPFERIPDRTTGRARLGIPEDALVVGHVGRFHWSKNHHKIIQIFGSLHHKQPNTYLLLVGDGELRASIEGMVRRYGISERVIFTGIRTDAIQLMQDVMDVFLLPSIYEGLAMALLEAQAAGLPCVISDKLPKPIEAMPHRVIRCTISEPDSVWADNILNAANLGRLTFSRKIFSRFDVRSSIGIWERIYSTGSVY